MNDDCVHKLGIIIKQYVVYGCVKCYRRFHILEAMDYLERTLGSEEGMKYWRALRALCEKMRREWKKGVRYEGTFLPE